MTRLLLAAIVLFLLAAVFQPHAHGRERLTFDQKKAASLAKQRAKRLSTEAKTKQCLAASKCLARCL